MKSSDVEVYVGGMTVWIYPDGTPLSLIGENMRNPHDSHISSFGDHYQSDNNDPAHARNSLVMEYASVDLVDLIDGSRSFGEAAKTRSGSIPLCFPIFTIIPSEAPIR